MDGTLGLRSARAGWLACAGLLLALEVVLLVVVARRTGCTTDEHHYFNSGRILVEHGHVHVGTVLQGPLALRANQVFVGDFPAGGFEDRAPGARALLFRGRLGTSLFVLPASVLVLLWSRRLFGPSGALVSLAALVLHPLWLAYSGLLLVDAQHASVLLAALAALALQLERPGSVRLCAFACLAAAALATKYLALLALGPAALLALGASVRAAPRGRRALAVLVALVVLVGGGLVALHACYGFGADYAGGGVPRSRLLRELQASEVARAGLAFLPEPFLAGLDFQRAQAERTWPVFLAGEVLAGSPRYYLLTFLWRTPELLLALGLLALLRLRHVRPRSDLVALGVPLGSLALLLSFTPMQLGVRYALALVPAGCLLLGACARGPWAPRQAGRGLAALVLLCAGLGLDLARNGPDWLGYFNATSGGQARAHRLLRDTSTDFGQHEERVAAWLAEVAPGAVQLQPHSGARFGRVAVRASFSRGARDPLRWAREGEPLAHLGAAWYVFEVTPAGLEQRARAADGGRLRRELVVALLGAGKRAAALQQARGLQLAPGDPLRRLLAAEDPCEPRLAPLWLRLGREDLAAAPGLSALREERLAWQVAHVSGALREPLERLRLRERAEVAGYYRWLE